MLRAPLDRILVGIRAQGHLRHGPDRQVAGRMSMGGAISVQLVNVHRQRLHFRARQEPAVNSKWMDLGDSLRDQALRQCRGHLPKMLVDTDRVCRCAGLQSVRQCALMRAGPVGASIIIPLSTVLRLRRLHHICPPVLNLRQRQH